jgi:F420-dependent oxidoreductase-like protein
VPDANEVVLPSPCLVVLVGPSGAGKSTWAGAHFGASQIVASDALRAAIADTESDVAATADAFAVLDAIVEHRARRRLTTVVDTLGLDPDRRAAWLALARRYGLGTACVVFETNSATCRARNRARGKVVPDRVLSAQLRRFAEQRDGLAAEPFDVVMAPAVTRVAPAHIARQTPLADRQQEAPVGLRFGLQLPAYTWPGGPPALRTRLSEIARTAEAAGFSSIWVMDHFRQIPMLGPAWNDMLESYTTLAFLAGVTEKVRLATLVTGVTYRNVAHLGKIVATLDVLSGGRAACGLGAGWFEAEHVAYGFPFPPLSERYARLEDALRVLPLLWGKGAPAYAGDVVSVPEAMCYPRPLQEHVPILVGGNGERRTLYLAAKYADACNIIGEVDVVRRKVDVLGAHCREIGRPRREVEVTQLSTTLVGRDRTELDAIVDRLRPRRESGERYARRVNAATVADQVGRFRALADAGVATAIVSLPDLDSAEAVERFRPVIDAFA